MALALSLVGQHVQPYLTSGAMDYSNAVQQGKEDAIRTEELKTQSQKSALDLLTAQKKQKDEQWYSDNAGALSRKVKTLDVADEDLAKMAQVNPEYHKVLQTERADAVKNFNASNLAYLGSSADKAKSAQEIIQASEAHGMTIPDQFKQSPETLMQYLRVINAGSKAFDLKNVSKDESGDIITTDITGNTTAINPAAVKAENTQKAPVTWVVPNGRKETTYGYDANGKQIVLGVKNLDAPKEAKTSLVRTSNGFEVVREGQLPKGTPPVAAPAPEKPMTKYQKIKLEGELRDDYRKDSSNFVEISRQAKIIESSLNDDSAAGTLASATAFMKMLDPGSVVRESELAMAMKTNGALDRMGNYMNVIQSGQVLTAQQKADFAKLIKAYSNASNEAQRNLNKKYSQISSEYGLDPKRVAVYDVEKDDKGGRQSKQDEYKEYVLERTKAYKSGNYDLVRKMDAMAKQDGLIK